MTAMDAMDEIEKREKARKKRNSKIQHTNLKKSAIADESLDLRHGAPQSTAASSVTTGTARPTKQRKDSRGVKNHACIMSVHNRNDSMCVCLCVWCHRVHK
eukprot:Opistho-2@75214